MSRRMGGTRRLARGPRLAHPPVHQKSLWIQALIPILWGWYQADQATSEPGRVLRKFQTFTRARDTICAACKCPKLFDQVVPGAPGTAPGTRGVLHNV